MKIPLILAMMVALAGLPAVFAIETEQEPGPPTIPNPSPEPGPIRLPDPEPAPNPFPQETESERIQRLTEEIGRLQQKNTALQGEIASLKHDNLLLQSEISELSDRVQELKEIIMEQIQVILSLTDRLEDVLFEKIFEPMLAA